DLSLRLLAILNLGLRDADKAQRHSLEALEGAGRARLSGRYSVSWSAGAAHGFTRHELASSARSSRSTTPPAAVPSSGPPAALRSLEQWRNKSGPGEMGHAVRCAGDHGGDLAARLNPHG